MADVTPGTSSSEEESDNIDLLFRLHMLINKCGHAVLANFVDHTLYAKQTTLSECLAGEKPTIQLLKRRGIITKEQYDLLYPSGKIVVTRDLSIMLIIRLLRNLNCFGLNSDKQFQWNSLPEKNDISIKADICRLSYYRNIIVNRSSIQEHEFIQMWVEIDKALLRINDLYPIADFKQTIFDIRHGPLDKKRKKTVEKKLQTAESKTGKMVEQYQYQGQDTSSNIKVSEHVLKIGDSVGSENRRIGCVGPFVRLQEKGEICFLTSGHIFQGCKKNELNVTYGPKTVYEKQDICGEVIATNKELDTALVKISDDFIPKHCAFVDVDFNDLSRTGLKSKYNIRGIRDVRKVVPGRLETIVVYCPNGRLLTGFLNPERYLTLHVDSPECPFGAKGSAVFLVEDKNSLSCIGILIGEIRPRTLNFILIQDILETLSLELGQSLAIETFKNKKQSISSGALSKDSDKLSSFTDKVIRSKDSQADAILDNIELTKLLLKEGRTSPEVIKKCRKICQVIKKESAFIVHVEAVYRFGDDKHVIFLVFAEKNIKIDLTWETEIKIINNYSDESRVVLHCKENRPLTEIESQKIGEIIDMHSKKLMCDHKFLSAISASSVLSRHFGPMRYKHKIEKRPCIVFNVLVKGIIPLNEEYFPKELDGTPVDVREGGVRLCVNIAEEYQENATIGCKITSSTCPGKSGTLGGFIEHPEYGLCGITCAHVVLNDDNKFELKELSTITVKEKLNGMVYQPDISVPGNTLGKLVQVTYMEGGNGKPGVDLALFRIETRAPKQGQFPDGTLPSFNEGLVWGKTGIPDGLTEVRKFGYVTLNTSGVMQFDNCVIREVPFHSKMIIGDDKHFLTTTLYKQYQIKSCDKNIPFCKQGDSGALVFMEDNTGEEPSLRCIGMLVALSADNSGYVTPITAILDELKVKQFKTFTTHSTTHGLMEQISGLLKTHFDGVNERLGKLEERMSRIEANNNKT